MEEISAYPNQASEPFSCRALLQIADAAQPTIGHTYFQYRTICPLYLAVFLVLAEAVSLLCRGRREAFSSQK